MEKPKPDQILKTNGESEVQEQPKKEVANATNEKIIVHIQNLVDEEPPDSPPPPPKKKHVEESKEEKEENEEEE